MIVVNLPTTDLDADGPEAYIAEHGAGPDPVPGS